MSGKRLAVVISAVVAGVLFWIFQLEGLEVIKKWFHGAEIEVHSFKRPSATEFFTSEKLHFVLKNVEAERVIWVFDEEDPKSGGIDFDYLFNLVTNSVSATRDHRVDAFYKKG